MHKIDAQLTAHLTALASLELPDGYLCPVIATWADLTPLSSLGYPLGEDDGQHPILALEEVEQVEAAPLARAVLRAVPTIEVDDEDGTADGDGDALELPADLDGALNDLLVTELGVELTFPIVHLGLVNMLWQVPEGLRMVLVDGPAPARPDLAVLTLADLAAVVVASPQVLHDAVHGRTVEALHAPMPVPILAPNVPTVVRSAQGSLWICVAALALGQKVGLNRLDGFANWADRDMTSADEADFITTLLGVTQALVSNSDDYGAAWPLRRGWPQSMVRIADEITLRVSGDVLRALAESSDLRAVATEHGWGAALKAAGVLVAARAALLAQDAKNDLPPATRLIAAWMTSAEDHQEWAVRATKPLLAHHDTAAFENLLCQVDDEDNPEDSAILLFCALHSTAHSLLETDWDRDELRTALAACDVRPANVEDVTAVCDELLRAGQESIERADPDECPAGEGANAVLAVGWGIPRLAAATAALIPMLADINAVQAGLDIGGDDWRQAREMYLDGLLGDIAESVGTDSP